MRRLFLCLMLAIGVAFGCNALFGIGDYVVVDADASTADGPHGNGDAANCENYDPKSGQCYPCEPKVDPQLLNACTDSKCIPFDDKARVPNLPADGKLPPVPDLPPPDASAG